MQRLYPLAPHRLARTTHPMSGWTGSTRRARLPRDWPATRRRILDRDGHRCTWPGCTLPATDVDHITPGDNHTDTNLRSLCTPHHRRKSAAEGGNAGARQTRPLERHPGL